MDDHELYPYYISTYALHVLDGLFNLYKIDAKYKKAKYQMLMLFRIKVGGSDLPKINDKKRINQYCSKIQKILWDNDKALINFTETTKLIDLGVEKTGLKLNNATRHNDPTRRRNFTTELISLITPEKDSKNIQDGQRQKGFVKWFDSDRGYGFIESEKGDDLFVHYSAIWGSGYKNLIKDQKVEFSIVEGVKGLQAKDVEISENE
jgi:cold shock protein